MPILMGTSFENLQRLPRPFGPFTLVRLIAQGGMGQVFLALRAVPNEPTDEVCVVKTVRTDLKDDREAVGRFLDEARVVQKLDHAAICHTLDAGVVGKTYYLAMEFISGRNLRDTQTRAQKLGRPMPEALIFHALAEMLDSLDYAHELFDPDTGEHMHIVHRDVSPHNVMLGFDGYVKLIDFGLAAHELKRELTRPGIMVGKLRYNAPEQVRDRAIDGRSDLYSVGVMLYELITGERFYEGLSEEDIWRLAMKGNHRPKLFSSVPEDLKAILDLSLTPTPDDRFASASAMKDAVMEAARSRNLREMRRQSARFMGEIFVEERQAERDMILQATGLAEARTRLFAMPSGESLHVSNPDGEASFSSVGRTNVVSPAQIRGRLADLVSAFDPNAATAFAERPDIEDGSLDDGSDAFATSQPRIGTEQPGTRSRDGEDLDDIAEHRTAVGDGTRPSDRTPRNEPTDPIPVVDDNPRARRSATSRNTGEQQPVSTGKLKRRAPASAPQNPQTSSRRREQPRRGPSVALVAAGAFLSALLLGGLAFALLPRLLGDPPAPERNARPPDLVEREPPADLRVVPRVDEATATVDAGLAIAELPPDQPDKPDRPAKPDKPDKPDKQKPRKPDKASAPKPPVQELKTLRDQVEYLRAFCMERVACARSMTDSAAQLVTLSAEETRQLMQEIPKCIARCQR